MGGDPRRSGWICYNRWFAPLSVPVSSRGQDTWFSATGPGFESPYRYHTSCKQGSFQHIVEFHAAGERVALVLVLAVA
jgi:hypothetical protein